MGLEIVYNVYHSIKPDGPWILSNSTPIPRTSTGNQYTVTGLEKDVLYYFLVVAGHVVDGEFLPLTSQAIGPDSSTTSELQMKPNIFCRTFAPHILTSNSIGHRFEISGITISSNLGHRFNVKLQFTETFEGTSVPWHENNWGAGTIDPSVGLTFTNGTFTGPGQTTTEDFSTVEVW